MAVSLFLFFFPSFLRVVLVIDEFDTLLEAPRAARLALLSSLRSLRTRDGIAPASHGPATALHAMLGIDVYRLLQLASGDEPRQAHSPFNVSDILSVPRTTLQDVRMMLRDFSAACLHTVPETVVEDVFWRSGGHVGLISMLGQQLLRLCGQLAPGVDLDDAMWFSLTSGSALLGEMRASATVASMLRSVSRAHLASPLEKSARMIVRSMLSAPVDSWLDVSDGIKVHREALDYLLTEGVVIEDRVSSGTAVHRIVAPMVVPLLMRDVGSNALVARLPKLPFPRRRDGSVNLSQTVLELLPFLNIDALYHPFALLKDGCPCEYAYHFQLFDLMTQRGGDGGWRVLGESRNATAPGPLRRLDLLVASNGHRAGLELLVDGDGLNKHVYEQAVAYRSQQGLASVVVVNFASSTRGIVVRIPTPLPPCVELLQVLVDRDNATLTPYVLQADGVCATPLAPVAQDVAAGGVESLVSPLATLSVTANAPVSVVLGVVAFFLDAFQSVGALLSAISAEVGKPDVALSVWHVRPEGTERRLSKAQSASALAFAARVPSSRLELRFEDGAPPQSLTLE